MPHFVTLEGCEGVGKSTHCGLLKEYFETRGREVVFTREPGGTPLAERIRDIILSKDTNIDAMTELLLYQAARRNHVTDVILPALKQGKIVICDRFIHSTLAYQGYGRGVDLGLIRSLNEATTDGVKTSLTLFFDLEPRLGFARKGGADKTDRMDSESLAFHERVYCGFKEIAQSDKNVATIDCSGSLNSTFHKVLGALKERGIA